MFIHNSHFELAKTQLMDFARPTIPEETDPFVMQGDTIQSVKSAKFLGVIFDNKLNWREQEIHAIAKSSKWISQYRRLAKTIGGMKPSRMRQLYLSVALPKLTYAADVWYRPIVQQQEQNRRSGSVRFLKMATTLQRLATTRIVGAFRTSPTDLLDTHAFMLPIELALDKVCYNAISRLCCLPASHPLYNHVRKRSTRQSAGKLPRHPSPIHHLLHKFQLDPKELKVETINTSKRPPSWQPGFDIVIATDKETAAENTIHADADVYIFSDGSSHGGQVGAAAILSRNGEFKHLQLQLGPDTRHTVYEAEAVGLTLGLHLLENEKGVGKAWIGLDNKAILQGITKPKPRAGQHLLDEARNKAERWIKETMRRQLKIAWTPGHYNIEGNEKADQLAKAAAEGQSSPDANLPRILRKTLPASVSALRQEHHKEAMAEWKRRWKSSKRCEKLERLDESLPSMQFLKATDEAGMNAAGLIFQLRSGHLPLNGYLHRFGIDTEHEDRCPKCPTKKETVFHFLIECPAHEHARYKARIGRLREQRERG